MVLNLQKKRLKGWKKDTLCKYNHNKDAVTMFIFGKVDLKTKSIPRDKDKHFITIKGSIL